MIATRRELDTPRVWNEQMGTIDAMHCDCYGCKQIGNGGRAFAGRRFYFGCENPAHEAADEAINRLRRNNPFKAVGELL